MPPEDYVNLLLMELRHRSSELSGRRLRSIYFGGGTPSLIAPSLIVSILKEVASQGFNIDQSTEITIEINPATVSKASLEVYLEAGVNRFSVGAQTFKESLLKKCGREHTAEQTRETLSLLKEHQLNFTFDLLFALPAQSLSDLEADLRELNQFQPNHLSAYCLTVPSTHPMSRGRPPEEEQLEMFELITAQLKDMGLNQYEISNFARPGFESQHNLSYWDNTEFWGLGLSAHSYLKSSKWGTRFWNPKSFDAYAEQVNVMTEGSPESRLPSDQVEELKLHESVTDICHMHLRTLSGLPDGLLGELFPESVADTIRQQLRAMGSESLLSLDEAGSWSLTPKGVVISNKIFERLTFLESDLPSTY